MTRVFFQLLSLFTSGIQLISLPGTPVDLFPAGDTILVLCSDPASLCRWAGHDTVDTLFSDLVNPVDVCMWQGDPAVSDPGSGKIVLPERRIEIPGEPAGICEVRWFPEEEPSLAVCLHCKGQVVLVNADGLITSVGEFPGARGVSSFDSDRDGDSDLIVSCCGSGVFLLENREGIPVVHPIGNIREGVKRVFPSDIDGDGLDDVVGIACATGGAGWWRNPGSAGSEWSYTVIDSLLQGPKNIWCTGDSVMVASLYSPVFFNYDTELKLPSGFISVFHTGDNLLLVGHYLRILAVVIQD